MQKCAVGTECCANLLQHYTDYAEIQIMLKYFKAGVMSEQGYFSQNSERPGFESWQRKEIVPFSMLYTG
jgi:hypothetical protein